MDYGSGYLRATRNVEDDRVSMLSAHATPSQYQPYNPNHSRDSSEDSLQGRPSFSVSPVALQQSLSPLSPLPPQQDFTRGPGASLFESRAILNQPYQAPVAYENAAPFRPAETAGTKPDFTTVIDLGTGSETPNGPSRRYFRHPRHILEPWRPGFWFRFPKWGIGALIGVMLCTLTYWSPLPLIMVFSTNHPCYDLLPVQLLMTYSDWRLRWNTDCQ